MAGAGIHRQVLSRLVREGALERVARAQYRLPDALVTEHHGLAVAAAAVPNGIVCLLSVALEALREAWRARRFTMDAMDRYARVCRVERVMRPYLEALVG